MMGRRFVLITAFVALGAASLAAQNPPQTPPPVTEQVVVTANRVQEELKNIPTLVEVITADEIQRASVRTVDELLRSIPGFSTLRQGSSLAGHPSVRSTSFRGLAASASRTLVMVDGVPINSPVTGIVYWPTILIENIERVEIVKSGGSGVWGNLAMGGVINIITKSAKTGEPIVSAAAQGGTQNSAEFHGAVRRASGPLSIAAATSYLTTDGYTIIRADRAGAADTPAADAIRTLDTKIEYRGERRGTWMFGGSVFSEAEKDGTLADSARTGAGTVRASGQFGRADGSRWQVTTFATRQLLRNYTGTLSADRRTVTPSNNQFSVPGDNVGTSVQWSRPVGGHQLLNAGGDVSWIRAEINEDSTFSAAASRFTRRRVAGGQQIFAGVFAESLWQITTRWRVVAAGRLNGWESSSGSRLETDLVSGTALRNEVYPRKREISFDPSVGTVFHPSTRVSLRASVNRGFRAPTTGELYRPFRSRGNVTTESNPALTPERSVASEAGADVRLGRIVTARVTGFSTWINNPVITTTIGSTGSTSQTIAPCGLITANGTCRQLRNAGQLRTAGLEFELEFHPGTRVDAGVSYMFDRSVVTSAPGAAQLVGKFNRQAPVHQAVLQLGYSVPRTVDISAQVRLVGTRYEDDINTVAIAPFASLDLQLSRAVSKNLVGFLNVQNLTDRENELTHSEDGIYSLSNPRLINAGLRIKF